MATLYYLSQYVAPQFARTIVAEFTLLFINSKMGVFLFPNYQQSHNDVVFCLYLLIFISEPRLIVLGRVYIFSKKSFYLVYK